jgi:hypothetical protein
MTASQQAPHWRGRCSSIASSRTCNPKPWACSGAGLGHYPKNRISEIALVSLAAVVAVTRFEFSLLDPNIAPRGRLIVNVANCLESFDDGLIIENDIQLTESARGIGQVLFKAFSEYQLRIAYCLSENENCAIVRRRNSCRLRSHDITRVATIT